MGACKIVFLAAIFFGLTSSVCAKDMSFSKKYAACMEKSGGVTSEMLNCIAAEASYQDARLNKAYRKSIESLNASRRDQLRKSQRAWIKFKEANCQFYADPDGGTSASLISNDCFLSTTVRRAEELEGLSD